MLIYGFLVQLEANGVEEAIQFGGEDICYKNFLPKNV
jgi:hypothetical protein